MSDNTNQWVELVQKINTQTQDGKLTWTKNFSLQNTATASLAAALIAGMPNSEVYSSSYKGKGFRITRTPGVAQKNALRQPEVKLEITDESGMPVWRVPDVVGISDLFQTVKMQSSGIMQFVDDFLRE